MNLRHPALGLLVAGAVALVARASNAPIKDSTPTLQRVAEYHLKHGRFAASAVTDGTAVYAVGGRDDIEIRGDIERLDPATHQCTVLTDKVLPRFALGAACIDGRIYLIGGEGNEMPGQVFEASVEVCDIRTGSITHAAPLPRPRAYFATATHGGKIYVMGGALGGSTLEQTNSALVFDPAANTWSEVASMPNLVETRAAVDTRDAILLLGGYRRPAVSTGVRSAIAYLPATNVWRELTPLNHAVSANSAALLGHTVYLFGNFDPADEIQSYDIHTGRSEQIKVPMDSASQSAAVTLNDRIYVVGGTEGGGRNWDHHHGFDTIQVYAAQP